MSMEIKEGLCEHWDAGPAMEYVCEWEMDGTLPYEAYTNLACQQILFEMKPNMRGKETAVIKFPSSFPIILRH